MTREGCWCDLLADLSQQGQWELSALNESCPSVLKIDFWVAVIRELLGDTNLLHRRSYRLGVGKGVVVVQAVLPNHVPDQERKNSRDESLLSPLNSTSFVTSVVQRSLNEPNPNSVHRVVFSEREAFPSGNFSVKTRRIYAILQFIGSKARGHSLLRL